MGSGCCLGKYWRYLFFIIWGIIIFRGLVIGDLFLFYGFDNKYG